MGRHATLPPTQIQPRGQPVRGKRGVETGRVENTEPLTAAAELLHHLQLDRTRQVGAERAHRGIEQVAGVRIDAVGLEVQCILLLVAVDEINLLRQRACLRPAAGRGSDLRRRGAVRVQGQQRAQRR